MVIIISGINYHGVYVLPFLTIRTALIMTSNAESTKKAQLLWKKLCIYPILLSIWTSLVWSGALFFKKFSRGLRPRTPAVACLPARCATSLASYATRRNNECAKLASLAAKHSYDPLKKILATALARWKKVGLHENKSFIQPWVRDILIGNWEIN